MDFPDLTVPIGTLFLPGYSQELTFLISSKQFSNKQIESKTYFSILFD